MVLEALNLHLTASLHDNANLARAGMARTAPANGLTELFLITYFTLLYAQILHYTILIPFLRILIINMESNYYVQLDFYIVRVLICVHDSIWILHLFYCESQKRLKEAVYHA